jgi:Leucine-rich repeat (LRR) protein
MKYTYNFIQLLRSAIYNNNLEWLDLSGTQISNLSFLKHLYNLDTLVLDSCQKIDVKEFENLKFNHNEEGKN